MRSVFVVYVGCASRIHDFVIVVKHEWERASSASSFSCPCHVHSMLGDVLVPPQCLQTNTFLAAFISTSLSHSLWFFFHFPFLSWIVLGSLRIYVAPFFNVQLLAALEAVVKSVLFTPSPIHSYCLALKCNYVSALEIPKISKDDTIAT